ncbi:hypothetical protein ERJ75_000461500 [Trypanosoma vivax]|uniref:Uncharacterized protein n=1 Tax=Trypanosoma vivax (strain Y486) TaxID=1055687 RepID=G0U552_TRYVY|nr:hypothetical protein TRVL_04648 [Trypanosoma vivax]KAH8616657.1 hypothetical protein ERJ75_000461500 [Trypanosoma vivax]CCC51000.1 conserved hypothetical protein [Trypanosoma vivax Y486]
MLRATRLIAASVAAGSSTAPDESISYTSGSHQLIPPKHAVGRRIAVRTYLDRNRTELSDRTFMPQKAWFKPYTPKRFACEHEEASHKFYNLETKLIWAAFDTPELIGILLHDETIKGTQHLYDAEFLDAAVHWTRESRYWRAIGITKPFFNKTTLRAHCWHDRGAQVGTLVVSQAMRHALMDLERALRRKELGLDPNYIWDRWGPIGFIDGARNDYLPRFVHNPYIDPDGVEVTELDVAPFNTHEQIKERYGAFIEPDLEPFHGVFRAPSHGGLTLDGIPNQQVVRLYLALRQRAGASVALDAGGKEVSPADTRALFYLCADPQLLKAAEGLGTWQEVCDMLAPIQERCDEKVEALRLLENTRHDARRVRSFYEEKCGFTDFMYTPDKTITAATLCYLQELRRICTETEWGKPLALTLTDLERVNIVGREAFVVYRVIEDAILESKRRAWAARFAGDAKEESTLDYLLENFGRRTEQTRNVGTTGTEFDREQEPIGRQVQRRVLDADKFDKLAEVRQKRGKMWSKKRTVFDSLHQKQLQNVAYGVR